jgi:hypothetical protein
MSDKGGLEKIAPKNEVTQEKVHPPQRTHRNGLNDTISHEVSPKTISLSHLLLKGLA